jgi:hypothetical protein
MSTTANNRAANFHDVPDAAVADASSADMRAIRRRVDLLASTITYGTDPWAGVGLRMAAEMIRSGMARQDSIRQILGTVGTGSSRLSAAQLEIEKLLKGARCVSRLLTIELERRVSSH